MSDKPFLWPVAERISQLEANHVHLWAWDLGRQPASEEWRVLSRQETQRAQRLVYPQDRDRFVRAHAVMRQLLGSYARIEPEQIVYSQGAYGKPTISLPEESRLGSQILFNLSHGADVAVLALSAQHELGVDIEIMRPVEFKVAARYFSPLELRALQTLPKEMWLRGFYRCWTSKEALLKGEGLGLRLPLKSFDVEADPRRAPALLAVEPGRPIHADWQLLELHPVDGAIGTLAIQHGAQASTHYFSFSR